MQTCMCMSVLATGSTSGHLDEIILGNKMQLFLPKDMPSSQNTR